MTNNNIPKKNKTITIILVAILLCVVALNVSFYVLDIVGADTADGANLQLWERNSQYAQLFELRKNDNGYYQIININSGKALAAENGGTVEHTNVCQESIGASNSQYWKLVDAGNDYSNDMVVGTWKFVGFIDDFDDIEYYDEELRTFKFYSNGTVKITDNDSNSSETYDYHVTKGGFIVIDLDVSDEVLIGTISPYDDELTIRSYYYSEYPEDIYWETQNGSVILRKSYNHYGRNLIEDDDGYIFEKLN